VTLPQATYLAALRIWRASLSSGQRRPRPIMQPAVRPALLRAGWVVEVESTPARIGGGFIRCFDLTPEGDAALDASEHADVAMSLAQLGQAPTRNPPVISAPADPFVPTARRGR
jgi:hypothetical protein